MSWLKSLGTFCGINICCGEREKGKKLAMR